MIRRFFHYSPSIGFHKQPPPPRSHSEIEGQNTSQGIDKTDLLFEGGSQFSVHQTTKHTDIKNMVLDEKGEPVPGQWLPDDQFRREKILKLFRTLFIQSRMMPHAHLITALRDQIRESFIEHKHFDDVGDIEIAYRIGESQIDSIAKYSESYRQMGSMDNESASGQYEQLVNSLKTSLGIR